MGGVGCDSLVMLKTVKGEQEGLKVWTTANE